MKIIISILLTCAMLFAVDYEEGAKAYQNADYSKAFKLWKKLAEKEIVPAQYNIAIMLLNGQGIKKNKFKAFQWFLKAAKNGHLQSQYALGNRYMSGEGTFQDMDKAKEWFLKSKKFIGSKIRLAELYCNGMSRNIKNYQKCSKYLYDAKVSGDKYASILWENHKLSEGNLEERTEIEKEKAQREFESTNNLAIQGNINSQYKLATYYYHGYGVKKDYLQTIKWLKKPIEKKHIKAQQLMGILYFKGKGINRDYKKGFEWLRLSADNGNQNVYSILSSINTSEEEYNESFEWLYDESKKGNNKAQYGLAQWHDFQIQNKQMAFKWYKESAENGHFEAQYILATYYYYGSSGAPKDVLKAIEWYKKAINNGHEGAKKAWKDLNLEKEVN